MLWTRTTNPRGTALSEPCALVPVSDGSEEIETVCIVDVLRRAGDAARASEAEWLRGALGCLNNDLRETAILVLDQELTHAQAGEVLGISENTVSWRLHELRKALRARAGEDLTT